MEYQFSKVMNELPPSFIREMLNLTTNKDIISFAGGLPDPQLFPQEEIKEAAESLLSRSDSAIFQYGTTEGHEGLRRWIADRFSEAHDTTVSADQVMIVSGSQQALDMVAKVLINPQDTIVIEEPSYLGAIQAFRMYSPKFTQVPLLSDGVDVDKLAQAMAQSTTRLFYGIPNFQNPTGLSYSPSTRDRVADILKASGTLMLEDDPYGELRFAGAGADTRSIYSLAPDNVIYMGSFSKIFVPGFRLGWVIAPAPIIEKLVIAKQAADLHTNSFVQALLYEYLQGHDLTSHVNRITASYAKKKEHLIQMLKTHLGEAVEIYPSGGGMFVWVKVPDVVTSDLLPYAVDRNVVFVPGVAFALGDAHQDHMRLNFTNLSFAQIESGIISLKQALKAYWQDHA